MTEKEFYSWYRNPHGPIQDPIEMWELLRVLNGIKASKILEVGTNYGGSSYFWNKLCGENNGYFIGIDVFHEEVVSVLEDSKTPTHFIKGNSNDIETMEKVIKIVGEDELDFIFIDGDHTTDAVYSDIKNYFQLLREGGVIAFHDAIDVNNWTMNAIERAIGEGILKYSYKELIKGKMGTYYLIRE